MLVFTALFLARALIVARIGLGDDEAYYWDWSRHLDLSYFDHPALSAWAIRVSTVLFGESPLGVRLPALLFNSLTGFMIWKLAREMFSARAAWVAAFLYAFTPGFGIGAILMVPDAPMGLAWICFVWAVWRIVKDGELHLRWWLLGGLAMGLGLLSKYTIVLLAFSTVAMFMTTPEWRRFFRKRGFWGALIISCLVALPIVVWNIQRGWPTVVYHLHDRQTGGGVSFARWGAFVASQALVLTPPVLVAVLIALGVAVKRRGDFRWRLIGFLSLPTLLIFTVQAMFAEFKPHWPAPAYVLLFIGIGALWDEGFAFGGLKRAWLSRPVGFTVLAILAVPMTLIFYLGTLQPLIPALAREAGRMLHRPISWEPKFDPTNDFYGWSELAHRVSELRQKEITAGRGEPFLASWRYQLVAQLAFATKETVIRTTRQHDQYSFLQSPDKLKSIEGRDAIFVADNRFDREPARDRNFATCEEQEALRVYRGVELARIFRIWICRGYRAPR